ncbi:MAG: energy-coupling factor ABC transporter ATP-binding protein [Deltaproteobacteria bacterium]|nr:energy-coupling factor ABC transporter ATP-binding protein [Deltaproteobacteria bacterium]
MSSETLIALENLTFAYPGGPPVLNGLNLNFKAGEILGLSGDNGAGKSTLLFLIMGLLKPQGGRVEIFGRIRREERDFQEVRPALGFVFQDANDQLFCPTVADDLAFGPMNLGLSHEEVHRRVDEVLERLGLAGFESRVTYDLSGGEKKLVAIGAALALRPRLMILDEPTSGLDPGTVTRLEGILAASGLPALIVSHDQDFLARVSTRRLTIKDGRLVD